MRITLTLKNYRCFADSAPATFTLQPGFTAFVGKNNAGKSTLARFFYEFRPLFQEVRNRNLVLNALNGRMQAFNPTVDDVARLGCNLNERPIEISLQFDEADGPADLVPDRVKFTIPRGTNEWTLDVRLKNGHHLGTGSTDVSTHGSTIGADGDRFNFEVLDEAAKILTDTLYVGSFRNAINQGSHENYFDVTVGQAFISAWTKWKTGPRLSSNQAALELTKNIARLFDYDTLEIQPTEDKSTLQVVADGQVYQLFELGSGLSQFILVLANVAMRKPAYLIIDEPELSLHPSLQLDFLETLGSYTTHGVLFSTHSLGLARSMADTIYAIQGASDGRGSRVTPYEQIAGLAEFVGSLNYAGSPELGFDRILLVEGVSDVQVFQHFLRLFRKEHQVLTLPLHGSSLINGSDATAVQLQELKRISPNIHVLIDSERKSVNNALARDRQGFLDLCDAVSIRAAAVQRRATENYFTQEAIDLALGPGHPALGDYGDSLSWSKSSNWRIARQLDKASLGDIGEFLEGL